MRRATTAGTQCDAVCQDCDQLIEFCECPDPYPPQHTQDSHCDVDQSTRHCKCGADHSADPCYCCGGRAFHQDGCAEMIRRDTIDGYDKFANGWIS